MTTIARNVIYGAHAEGTGVILRIGGANIGMGYEEALKLSQFLRMAGKQAKAAAGDKSRHWSVVAHLSAAENSDGVARSS